MLRAFNIYFSKYFQIYIIVSYSHTIVWRTIEGQPFAYPVITVHLFTQLSSPFPSPVCGFHVWVRLCGICLSIANISSYVIPYQIHHGNSNAGFFVTKYFIVHVFYIFIHSSVVGHLAWPLSWLLQPVMERTWKFRCLINILISCLFF